MFLRHFLNRRIQSILKLATFRIILSISSDQRYAFWHHLTSFCTQSKTNDQFTSLVKNIFLLPVTAAYWVKTRTSYTTNSWVFTTNHKRISVNYFNFVLVAGTAGMSLATVIRLEFAYPGVGVLATDSLRYLSTVIIVYGVVTVFCMITPAILRAFGNFLLPTQFLESTTWLFPRLSRCCFLVSA